MTRDYKHKHIAPKKVYQRRSQQQTQDVADIRLGRRWFWPVIVLMSVSLIGGFFVVEHFAAQGVKSDEQAERDRGAALPSEEAKVYKAQGVTTVSDPVSQDSLEKGAHAPLSDESATQAGTQVGTQTAPQSTQSPPQIRYTFYKGLAETEVLVEAEPISVKLEHPYYIQAGTFNTEERALKEQARLAKENLHLTISTIEYQGKTYYRLRMGPYEDRLVMNRQRNELRRYGVDTLLIRQTVSKTDGQPDDG